VERDRACCELDREMDKRDSRGTVLGIGHAEGRECEGRPIRSSGSVSSPRREADVGRCQMSEGSRIDA